MFVNKSWLWCDSNLVQSKKHIQKPISTLLYSGTPFERPLWREANPSGKATWQWKSKHKYIDFYPWQEATLLERPLFGCKMGGLTRGVSLYTSWQIFYLQAISNNVNCLAFSSALNSEYNCVLYIFVQKEAECEKLRMDSKYAADTKIADSARHYQMQKASFDMEVNARVGTLDLQHDYLKKTTTLTRIVSYIRPNCIVS